MKLLFITVALSATFLLSSFPKADARAYRYNRRPCSELGLSRRGRKTGLVDSNWDFLPLDHGSSMLDNFVADIFRAPLLSLNSLYEQSQRRLADTMSLSSPRYDIAENEEKMELFLELPGVHPGDVSVELHKDGRAINISGSRKYKRHGEIVTSEFQQTFTIDDAVIDVNTIEANLREGVLVVSARKKPKNLPTDRRIPIHAKGVGSTAGLDDTEKAASDITQGTNDEARLEEANTDDIEISEEEDI